MEIANMLEKRREVKRKKPIFARKDSNKKKRIEPDVWRKARGCDNKQRLKRKGHKKTPRSGYRSPVLARGLDRSGLAPVIVNSPVQLQKLTKNQGAVIASGTGDRKRRMIIEEAAKLGLKIINVDAQKALAKIDAKFTLRKSLKRLEAEKKTELEKEKAAKDKEKKTKDAKQGVIQAVASEKDDTIGTEETASKDEALSEEDKKKLEKEEKDKIIIQKK